MYGTIGFQKHPASVLRSWVTKKKFKNSIEIRYFLLIFTLSKLFKMQKTAKSLDELYCDMIKAEKYLQRIIKENWPTRRIDAARYSYSQAQQKYNETESNFFTHKNLER